MVDVVVRADLQFQFSGINNAAFLNVVGISDVIQLSVTTFGSQTANIVSFADGGGSPFYIIDANGDTTYTGDTTVNGDTIVNGNYIFEDNHTLSLGTGADVAFSFDGTKMILALGGADFNIQGNVILDELIQLKDNKLIYFGAGFDSYLYYNGVNMLMKPNQVGSGILIVLGASAIETKLTVGQSSSGNASAVLEAVSTTKGFLPPRWTTTQRDNIASPVAGLEGYNTTTNKKNFYNGSAWEEITSA